MHFRRHRTCCTKDTKGYGLNKAPWIWPRKWPPKHTKDYSASDSMRPNGTSDCTEVDTVNLGRIGRPYGTLDIARCRNQHPRVLNSYSSPLDEAINQRFGNHRVEFGSTQDSDCTLDRQDHLFPQVNINSSVYMSCRSVHQQPPNTNSKILSMKNTTTPWTGGTRTSTHGYCVHGVAGSARLH